MPVRTPAVALRPSAWEIDPKTGLFTLDDYAARILQPMIDNMQKQVAEQVMQGSEGGLANLQINSLSGELAVGDEVTFPGLRGNSLLTMQMITREAVQLFANSNKFIEHINSQYDNEFAKDGAKIGQELHIRLPQDYAVKRDG